MIKEEYGIKTKPYPPGNPQSNEIIEIIHKVLKNLLQTYNLHETYADDAEPWMGILSKAAFALQSMYHSTKQKIRAN